MKEVKRRPTPKMLFIKSLLVFLWAEIKTMNMVKLKALIKMAYAQILIKLSHRPQKKKISRTYTPQRRSQDFLVR